MSRHGLVTDYPHSEINLGADVREKRELIDEVVDVLSERPIVTMAALVALGAITAGVLSTLARRSRGRHDVRDVKIARALRRHADPLRR